MTAKTTGTKSAFDFDMFKVFEQFKIPGFDMDAIMASQRKNVEAAAAANQRAFEGMSALVRRQTEVARETAEAGMKGLQSRPILRNLATRLPLLTAKNFMTWQQKPLMKQSLF